MWSNAMAAVFCPHMMGSSDCCLMQKAKAHYQDRVSDSSTSMTPDSMDHSHMPVMDMQDMPMDVADMQVDDATALQPKLDRELLTNLTLEYAPNKELTAEAFTQPSEPCPHCMMHSRSSENFPLRVAVQNGASYQLIAADAAATIVKGVPSSLTFVELHDHSPPGSPAALYVLVNAFRI